MTTNLKDSERAVETLMHGIAACVHFGMKERGITRSKLKELLVDWADKSILDDMLAATGAERINSSHLSDVAFVLGFKCDFKIKPLERPVEELSQAQADAP